MNLKFAFLCYRKWCDRTLRTLRTLRTVRVKKYFFRWNGEESLFPDPRPVPWFARCLPRRSLAEPGPNCRNCPKSSRYFPRRLSLVPRSSFGGWNRRREKHGAARPKPRAGQGPAPRKNADAFLRMLLDHRCSVGTVEVFPRRLSLLRRSSFGGWNRRREEHGATRPKPRAGQGPAPRKNAIRIFSYAVGPPVFHWNGEERRFPTLAPFHGLRVACHGAAWRSRVRIVRIVRIVRKIRGKLAKNSNDSYRKGFNLSLLSSGKISLSHTPGDAGKQHTGPE